jgi:hypothetical protein
METIANSSASEWTTIDRPVFAQDAQQVSGGGHPVPWVEIQEHHSLLSFRPDLRISIAIGLPDLTSFAEDWAQSFPDQRASSDWIDFRYNGVPVFRGRRVLVDGARAGLPCPAFDTKDIPARQYYIWALIDEVVGGGRMGEYFKRAGLQMVETHWPLPKD